MRYIYYVGKLLLIICLLSCDTEKEVLVLSETPEEGLTGEFFKLKVDGDEFKFTEDRTKQNSGKALGAETYAWYDDFHRKKTALKFWGAREGKRSEQLQKIGGLIKDYQGPNYYSVGQNEAGNFCHYFFYGVNYYSGPYEGKDGFVLISQDENGWVSGRFEYVAYNTNDNSDFKKVEGSFRLKKEN